MAQIQETLLKLAAGDMGVTRKEAAEALAIAEINASAYLTALCRDGRVARVGGGTASRYCLPQNAESVSRRIPDYEHSKWLKITRRIVPAKAGQYIPSKYRPRSVFEWGGR